MGTVVCVGTPPRSASLNGGGFTYAWKTLRYCNNNTVGYSSPIGCASNRIRIKLNT
jgi:hypothetical protein